MAAESVERFTAEAEDARTRIASTIDEIQDRLDPRRMLNDAVERVSGGGVHLFGQLKDGARAHPLAIAAAVAAIGIAVLARNKLANARVDLGEVTGDYTDYDDDYGAVTARPEALYGDEYDSDALAQQGGLAAAGTAARARAGAVAARAEASVTSNPLVSIVLGLAAGAALGALFPATEAERRAIGESGHKLGAAARAAARKAVDELDAAGISLGNVRAVAGEAKRKVGQAARSVVGAARDEYKGQNS